MTRLVTSRYSAVRLLSIVRRHIRLCRQVFNAENLVQQIQTSYDDLIEKQKVVTSREEVRENAYDDLILADNQADDAVRNVFRSCEQHDRDFPGSNDLIKVFPDKKFSGIIHLPFARELIQIEQIAVRIESLGNDHPFFSFASALREKASAVNNALEAIKNAKMEKKIAEAEMEVTKESLVRQYELNYLDARRNYGKRDAEKLFPKTKSRIQAEDAEDVQEHDTAA